MSTFSREGAYRGGLNADHSLDYKGMIEEFREARIEDAKYKRVDTMKKRQITKAKDYDEFRSFVLCAEDGLGSLTPSEVQELGKQERGWSKMNEGGLLDFREIGGRSGRPKLREGVVSSSHTSCHPNSTQPAAPVSVV